MSLWKLEQFTPANPEVIDAQGNQIAMSAGVARYRRGQETLIIYRARRGWVAYHWRQQQGDSEDVADRIPQDKLEALVTGPTAAFVLLGKFPSNYPLQEIDI